MRRKKNNDEYFIQVAKEQISYVMGLGSSKCDYMWLEGLIDGMQIAGDLNKAEEKELRDYYGEIRRKG